LDLPGIHGGAVYGAEANAPTFGARTHAPAEAAVAAVSVRRDATLLRAAEASEAYADAAIRAATMVNLGIGFLHVLIEAWKARLQVASALERSKYFITEDHVTASALSMRAAATSPRTPRPYTNRRVARLHGRLTTALK
jgi:hypothetical protein